MDLTINIHYTSGPFVTAAGYQLLTTYSGGPGYVPGKLISGSSSGPVPAGGTVSVVVHFTDVHSGGPQNVNIILYGAYNEPQNCRVSTGLSGEVYLNSFDGYAMMHCSRFLSFTGKSNEVTITAHGGASPGADGGSGGDLIP